MAKELPYFKFYCSEWNDGDITLEGYEIQGLYINICSWYWSRECNITIEQLKKKFAPEADIIDYLVEINLLKNISGKISISFLDEQLKDRKKICKRNKANGLKGGRPKTQSVLSGIPKNNPDVTNIEEKRREEKREDILLWLADAKPEYLDICERFYLILADHGKITKSVNWKTQKWYNAIRLMIERDNITMSELNFALNHLNKHLGDEFCPQAYSASSLRTKWVQIQNHISRHKPVTTYKDLPKQGHVYVDKEKGIIYENDGSISTEWEWDSHIKQVVML